jgi:hypothetical protein
MTRGPVIAFTNPKPRKVSQSKGPEKIHDADVALRYQPTFWQRPRSMKAPGQPPAALSPLAKRLAKLSL